MAQDKKLKDAIHNKLVETGEYDRLKELLRQRLVESQWRDSLKQYTMDLIKKKGGDTPFTVEQLTHEITPQGRETVPDDVKSELLAEIRRFVEGLDSSVQAGVES
ncbi:hypothetical protein EMIHUDRAFT_460889 [Emiliania huxleyi CCMP1516]|uniref:Transcription and mRNA export factor ENY2 n=2 Tax=Emiliania huxleyi TaxID=2903 RepID=A0A0D3KYG3_EMIH1|nr:hypothetical protein EMIHUDRAFT_207356 [Emiliania huxleyi CCMP1516]XP_005793227.1 hypothetical protein EMIHUDRAFT_460889 [Emiliania huxleyi CCMP1516]EOD22209.1 hypothetical protein EMIHUDRAFT_207356 [Emiliania huxleyi CCMP1516]EOD40798.1 hypothetical protein EMIHUDRAFT_460889 [Emiliania huxleyi CCMP1516]|eukprot:XP_005774638.1 hypothetical protein EMIHUDRAFT_207356 [Emiliania huxleyi CCMP1516]